MPSRGDAVVSHPSLLPVVLGLTGFGLCFFLPHVHSSVDLLAHVVAAALAVVALAINMAGEARRRPD